MDAQHAAKWLAHERRGVVPQAKSPDTLQNTGQGRRQQAARPRQAHFTALSALDVLIDGSRQIDDANAADHSKVSLPAAVEMRPCRDCPVAKGLRYLGSPRSKALKSVKERSRRRPLPCIREAQPWTPRPTSGFAHRPVREGLSVAVLHAPAREDVGARRLQGPQPSQSLVIAFLRPCSRAWRPAFELQTTAQTPKTPTWRCLAAMLGEVKLAATQTDAWLNDS